MIDSSTSSLLLLQFINFQLALTVVVLIGCKAVKADLFFKKHSEELNLVMSMNVLQFAYATFAVFRATRIWYHPDEWHPSAVDSFFGTTLAIFLLSILALHLNGVDVPNPYDDLQEKKRAVASLSAGAGLGFISLMLFDNPLTAASVIGHITVIGDFMFKIVFNVMRAECRFFSPFTYGAFGSLLTFILVNAG